MLLEWVKFTECLPGSYWFCDGVLFIQKSLPNDEIIKIIKDHLGAA